MIQLVEEKENCCGCTACFSICPKHAIEMKEDEEGFLYPIIYDNLCIECGLCQKVCAFQHDSDPEADFEQRYFAVRIRDKNALSSSSSGGVFTCLSDKVLAQGGTVFGAVFDKNFNVMHTTARTEKQRNRMRGSKYVQSDMKLAFTDVVNSLRRGEVVMFVGSPCQVDGLKRYLFSEKIDIDNLLLCDFICHGVSSPLVWREYIALLENKLHGKIIKFKFRSKKYGWKKMKSHIYMERENGKEDISEIVNRKYSYLNIFSSLVSNRPSCFNCKYTSYNRESDITMADFWNIDSISSKMNDDAGVSTVLINTEKGNRWFEVARESMEVIEIEKKDCWQPHLEYSCKCPAKREQFWELYKKRGAEYILCKYARGTFFSNMIRMVTPVLKKLGLYVLAGKVYNMVFGRKKYES